MRDQTITFYHKLGEDTDGVGVWQRTVIRNVSVFRVDGVRQLKEHQLEPMNRTRIYIHEAGSIAERQWVEEAAFVTLTDETLRDFYYTVSTGGKDRVVFGEHPSLEPPEEIGVARVMLVHINHGAKTRRLNHLELECQ